jgi:steroid delta-isomerase-like uncharacterized protein
MVDNNIEAVEARNRELIRRSYTHILMNKDVNEAIRIYDEMFDDSYVDHMLFDYPVMAPNKDALREQIRMMITSFSDINAEIVHLLADHDKVAHYASFSAVHSGNFMGIPPSGKTLHWTEVHMSRVEDGKIVEHWGHIDIDAMMRQLGINPAQFGQPG